MANLNFDLLNKSYDKFIKYKMIDHILNKRYCHKHMKEYIKKKNIKKGFNVVQLLGICSKCFKGGIVYYLETIK
jgi:hypothetical protein